MKIRVILLLLALIALLFVSGAAYAKSNQTAVSSIHQVQWTTAAGAEYHLRGSVWRASGESTGGDYKLSGPADPALTGNGCCCMYLPCVRNNVP